MTQAFGVNAAAYQQYGLPGHEGIDFRAPVGSPVYAVADGTVSQIRLDGNAPTAPYGNQIRVEHVVNGNTFTSVYAHLSHVNAALGQHVNAGDVIAASGNTGHSTGAHLHFTLKKKGATASGETRWPSDIVDPTLYFR